MIDRSSIRIRQTLVAPQDNVPISVRLPEIVSLAPGPHVSIGWLIEQLGPRSFGLTFFAMGLLGLIPDCPPSSVR